MSQPNDQSKSILTTGQYCPHQMLISQQRPAHPDSSDQIRHKIKLVILELKLINHLCSSLSLSLTHLSRRAYMRFVHKSISSDLNSISSSKQTNFNQFCGESPGRMTLGWKLPPPSMGRSKPRVTSPGKCKCSV